MAERFSKRYGHSAAEKEITIRDDAPLAVREAILSIAEGQLGLSPSFIREVLCQVLSKLPDSTNWSEYPNIWHECQYLLKRCEWFSVYDFVEALYRALLESSEPDQALIWQQRINDYFNEMGVGWRLVGGNLESRGAEAFRSAVDNAREELQEADLPTARGEIHEALEDLSRRPEPDLTGAIQHGMAALECTARECVGDPKATLGDIIKKYPGLFPKPLDEALSKAWGYASETGRHIREGRTPTHPEAELIVGVAAATCIYLAAKIKERAGK